MDAGCKGHRTGLGGIVLHAANAHDIVAARNDFLGYLEELGLERHVKRETDASAGTAQFWLDHDIARAWAPGFDTTQLCARLHLDTHGNRRDLAREIVVAMLLGPIPFRFPSWDELACAIRIRQNIVEAARRTQLSFHTTEAERPAGYWTYVDGAGFTLVPGKSLIAALQKATQPDESGTVYSFSCYRATEYVILLGIAQELSACNPELYFRLQKHWQSRAIMSGAFHDVFLREHGTMSEPLPLKYFVPGDRTWFRNPDDHSSDVTGYEGSWVMYLGGGLFTNFWKRSEPYTLTTKCVEVFHWRNGTYRDGAGELQIDEAAVEARVRASMADAGEVDDILAKMMRYREPSGVYIDGGCIDTTREYPRWVCPRTSDLGLPA